MKNKFLFNEDKIDNQFDLETFAGWLAGKRGKQLVKEVMAETCAIALCVNRKQTIAEMVEKVKTRSLSPILHHTIPAAQTPFGITIPVYKMGKGFLFSALAHKVIFTDGSILPSNPALAKLVNADVKEEILSTISGFATVAATPKMSSSMQEILNWIRSLGDRWFEYHCITSVWGVRAGEGTGGVFISPVTTLETARLPHRDKRCHLDKFATAC